MKISNSLRLLSLILTLACSVTSAFADQSDEKEEILSKLAKSRKELGKSYYPLRNELRDLQVQINEDKRNEQVPDADDLARVAELKELLKPIKAQYEVFDRYEAKPIESYDEAERRHILASKSIAALKKYEGKDMAKEIMDRKAAILKIESECPECELEDSPAARKRSAAALAKKNAEIAKLKAEIVELKLAQSVEGKSAELNAELKVLSTLVSGTPKESGTFHFGSGVPTQAFGAEGDSYYDTDTSAVYLKENGAWTELFLFRDNTAPRRLKREVTDARDCPGCSLDAAGPAIVGGTTGGAKGGEKRATGAPGN